MYIENEISTSIVELVIDDFKLVVSSKKSRLDCVIIILIF